MVYSVQIFFRKCSPITPNDHNWRSRVAFCATSALPQIETGLLEIETGLPESETTVLLEIETRPAGNQDRPA